MGCNGCTGDCSSCGSYGEVINPDDLPTEKKSVPSGREVRIKVKDLESRDAFRAVESLLKRFKMLSGVRVKRGEVTFFAPDGFGADKIKSALKEKGFHPV